MEVVVVVDTLVVVGRGELVLNMVKLAKDNGLPGQSCNVLPPVHCRVWGPSGPANSRLAVQLPTVAVSVPVNAPPVVRGSAALPNTPLTAPLVPFSIT
jgi:hypothetical protein